MIGVRDPFVVDLNWHPAYSTSKLPEGYDEKSVPAHWIKMLTPVDPKQGTPKFRNVHFMNVTATNAQTCIKVSGIENSTIDGFDFDNVHFSGENAGTISWAKDWKVNNFSVNAKSKLKLEHNKNVDITK